MSKETINVKDLKKIQIKILNYFDKFCKKNKLNYWIDCGTLLGAVRHKGYIPWDDDIDVGMLREDYDRLIQLSEDFNDNNQYRFNCYEINRNWQYPMGKVLDINTILYEPVKKNGIKSSVYIDVFVYDNVPNDEKVIEKMYNRSEWLRKLNSGQNVKRFYTKEKQKYNFVRGPIYFFLNMFPKNIFIKKRIENSKKYSKIQTSYVGNFMGMTRMKCSKDVFHSFVELEFEGKKYPAPVGYDKWLKSFYGDYMKLPPQEKRVSHHIFEAYYKDDNNIRDNE